MLRNLFFAIAVLTVGVAQQPHAHADAAMTYNNCNQSWRIDGSPQRIIALNQHAADLVIALGGQDRLVGVSWIDDDPQANITGVYRGVPVITKHYPPIDLLLTSKVDFAVGGFVSAFRMGQGPSDRQGLMNEGIGSYLLENACPDRGDDQGKIASVIADIEVLSRLLGAEEQGRNLIDHFQSDLQQAKAIAASLPMQPTFFVWDSLTRSPRTQGQDGFLSSLARIAGGRPAFDDLTTERNTVSWEDVALRDPNVLILVDAIWSTVADKIRFLKQDPVLSELTAVRNNRFIPIRFSHAQPNMCTARTVMRLAQQMQNYAKELRHVVE